MSGFKKIVIVKLDGDVEADKTELRIRELEARKRELEKELGAFERADIDLSAIEVLERDVEELEAELKARKEEETKKMDESRTDPTAIRKSAEDLLDRLAKGMQKDGETFEQAYARAVLTDQGRAVLATLDDAVALQTGRPTMREVRKHVADL